MNFHRISRISLAPDVVDGIVFWTKNPVPMLDRLGELNAYMYYFQFTITPYGKDIEPNIPSKSNLIIPAFKKLSEIIGANRVIWRYDPIFISEKYPMEYHVHAFGKIAEELHKHTRKVVISFIDVDYRGVKRNIKELALQDFPSASQIELSSQLAKTAQGYGLLIDTCAEGISLKKFGIEHARCIDNRLFENLLGCSLKLDKDKNQRLECGCVASVDIGMYNTCQNGCRYCYANYSQGNVLTNYEKHNPLSPLISGEAGEADKVNEKKDKSCRDNQMRLYTIR
jgi:DNA repair photolyase